MLHASNPIKGLYFDMSTKSYMGKLAAYKVSAFVLQAPRYKRVTKCYRGFRTSPRMRKGNFLDRLKVKLQLASAKHLSRIISPETSTVEISLPINEKVLQSIQTYLLHRVSETSASMENVKKGLISGQKSASNKESVFYRFFDFLNIIKSLDE